MMKFLDLKIPPPVVVVLTGLLMWLTPSGALEVLGGSWSLYLGIVLMLLGVLMDGYAAMMFIVAKTTISPIAPQNASTLIVSGIFKLTRNPMYLGMAVLLLGWALLLQSAAALMGPILFITYITRFQILPEERILTQKWGDTYTTYLSKTKRWL
jgi:protein-S-isoprenylcysteine O-methyltransferase Ste14